MRYDVAYLRHRGVFAQVDVTIAPVADSQFYSLPGLADPNAISIRSVNLPAHFLVHDENAVLFAAYDGTGAFARNATWRVRPGPADETWISLEAYNRPGFCIGR